MIKHDDVRHNLTFILVDRVFNFDLKSCFGASPDVLEVGARELARLAALHADQLAGRADYPVQVFLHLVGVVGILQVLSRVNDQRSKLYQMTFSLKDNS